MSYCHGALVNRNDGHDIYSTNNRWSEQRMRAAKAKPSLPQWIAYFRRVLH